MQGWQVDWENLYVHIYALKYLLTRQWIFAGYYRVLYNDALERLILEQLQQDHDVIHSHSRSQLLDDYFNFVWDGKNKYR